MDQFQKVVNAPSSVDLSRLNQFALRETEDGTYQFITMPPRSMEQEYIDHVSTYKQLTKANGICYCFDLRQLLCKLKKK